jgi:peptide/nickel transport system ATP-binding protein/oligopeptide transport system ATP-binding protein
MSDRVGVMYLGQLIEEAPRDDLYTFPKHPYTYYLLAAIPIPDPELERTPRLLSGDVPSPVNIPTGCRFHPRCPYATEKCKTEVPLHAESSDHMVVCHYDIDLTTETVAPRHDRN